MKKKIIGILIIGILIIGIILVGLTGCSTKTDRKSYKYGRTVIEVLNSYKDGNITAKDASKQLEDLSDESQKESDNIREIDFEESHRLSMISSYANMAYIDLYFKETMSILKINECIENIEEQINN